jgi:hypothetical protein
MITGMGKLVLVKCFDPVRVGWQNPAYWGLMKYQNYDNGTFDGYLTSLLSSHLFIAEYSSTCCSGLTYGDEVSDSCNLQNKITAWNPSCI